MKIYLKHIDRKQFICIQSHGKGSIELEVYHNRQDFDMSYSVYEDEQPDKRHSWYANRIEKCWVQGVYEPKKAWQQSTKVEFMEAYKNAKNTIKTFADKLIMQ